MGLVKKEGAKSALEKLRGQKAIEEKIASGTLKSGGMRESLVIALDGSASMNSRCSSEDPRTKWSAAVEATKELARDSLMSAIGVVVFDEHCFGHQPVGTAPEALYHYLAGLRPGGGTDFNVALRSAKNVLDEGPARSVRRIILLSDGYDGRHSGNFLLEQIMDQLEELQIVVDTVGFGDADEACLRAIASRTGGVYRHATDARALMREFKRLEAGIRGLLAPATRDAEG